ncbi:MAG: TetR family transcriptional regulator [Leucobacter sp.]
MRNSRDDVVAAALRVLEANGLEFCSMRRVAAELDVQPSALYHHVPNKQTLLALMADEIVRDVRGDTAENLCLSLRGALLATRDGADVVATASAFRLGASTLEARLAELVGSDGARTLLLYTFGHAQASQMQAQASEVGAIEAGVLAAAPDPEASFHRGLSIILAGLRVDSLRD